MPEMTDEIYLIYSRTGSRSEGDRIDGQRRGRVGTLALAELLENKGRFIPELEKTIRSLCEEKTWVGVAHDGNLANFNKKQVTIDLYSSALAWHLATADNLLGDKLSPATRELIRKEIQWRIFEPYHRMIEGKQSRVLAHGRAQLELGLPGRRDGRGPGPARLTRRSGPSTSWPPRSTR